MIFVLAQHPWRWNRRLFYENISLCVFFPSSTWNTMYIDFVLALSERRDSEVLLKCLVFFFIKENLWSRHELHIYIYHAQIFPRSHDGAFTPHFMVMIATSILHKIKVNAFELPTLAVRCLPLEPVMANTCPHICLNNVAVISCHQKTWLLFYKIASRSVTALFSFIWKCTPHWFQWLLWILITNLGNLLSQ